MLSLTKQKRHAAGQEGVNSEVGGMKKEKKKPLATQGQRER